MPINSFSKSWDAWDEGPPVPYVEKELLARVTRGLILDLGCGTGGGMTRFQEYGWETVGIDIAVSMQKKLLRIGKFVCASGQFLPFRNEVFDVIILAQVLHHIPQSRQTLSEANRCLKMNGYVLIGENIEDNFLLRLGRAMYPTHDGIEKRSDYSQFRKDGLKDLIQGSGFKILNDATGVVLWVTWYELTKRIAILRPLSFFVKKIDNRLEKLLSGSNSQYYCLCTKTVASVK